MSSRTIPILILALTLTLSGLVCLWFGLSFMYAILVTGLAGAIILAARSPLWLILSLVVIRMSLDYFGDIVSLPITQSLSVTLSQSIGVGVAILGILAIILHREVRSALRFTVPLGIMFLWGLVSLLVSISPGDTIRELLRIFDIAALAILAYMSVRDVRDYRLILGSIFVSSIAPIGAGIYQYANGIGFSDDAVSIPRIFGTFSHPNVFSLYLFVLIATVVIAAVIRERRDTLSTVRLIVMTGIFAATLILTYTRVAWVILFLFILFLTLARWRILLLPLIILPLLLYVIILPFQERVDSIFQADPGSSVAWRQVMWKSTIQKTLSEGNSLTGYGMSTFPLVSDSLDDPSIGANEAHNDFVKFFVEGGVVGLLAYLGYLVTLNLALLRRSWETRKWPNTPEHIIFLILFGLTLSLTAASLSDNVFKNTPVQWILWILIGASIKLFGVQRTKRRKRIAAPNPY